MNDLRFAKSTPALLLLAIVALGAFLRLYNLGGACLWIDEITFVNESKLPTFLGVWSQMLGTYHWQHQPAVPRMIEWLWLQLAQGLGLPINEAAYRFPAAIMGIATIVVMYQLGRRMFGERIGMLAAFLLSINFFHIWYSREAYNYSPFVLCALWSWYWMVRIYEEWMSGGRATTRSLVWYSITTALTLQMVMAGIVFVVFEFLALVLAGWSKPMRSLTKVEKSCLLRPVFIAFVVAWVPFLPFLWKLFHYVSADTHAVHPDSLIPFVKMLGEMGWSSQPIPLTLFVGCVVTGVWIGLRDKEKREATILSLVLGVASALGIGYMERLGRFESRYFISLLPALLLFVALAWARVGDIVPPRLPRVVRLLAWLVPALALLLWHVSFYNQLYHLRAKLLNGRGIAEWIVTNTPAGSTYILDNVYVRREIPMFYATPGRNAASPDAHLSAEDYESMREFVKDLYRRFPDCYFVDTQHVLFSETDGSPSEWLRTRFRRHARIENPALLKLVRWGVYPSSCFYPAMTKPYHANVATDIYFNTIEDIQETSRNAGMPAIALFGPEWEHCQIPAPQGGIHHWKGLRGDGRIFVHGLGNTPVRAVIKIRCASYQAAQAVSFAFGDVRLRVDFPADQPRWIELDPVMIKPGVEELTVSKAAPQTQEEIANFMVYEIQVLPVKSE